MPTRSKSLDFAARSRDRFVAQWHGWEADELGDEIDQIYFGSAVVENPDHTSLTVDGGDVFELSGQRRHRSPRDAGRIGPRFRMGRVGWTWPKAG